MKWINISEELLEMLDPYAEWFFQQDLDWINEKANKNEKNTNTIAHACGDDYLKEIVDKDGEHIGYPEQSYSYDLHPR